MYRARYLGVAGALALVSGSLFPLGAPTLAATINIQPMVISHLASTTQPPTQAQCVETYAAPCYQPAQIQTAYDEQPLFAHGITGAGQTIVIVDSFGSPTIQADLTTFDQQFGLPAPPSFRVIQPAGAVPPYDPTNSDMVGWAGETTLDVEWAHTMAPGRQHPPGRDPGLGDGGDGRLPADRPGRELCHRPSPRRGDQPELQRDRGDLPDRAVAARSAQRLHQCLPARGDRPGCVR